MHCLMFFEAVLVDTLVVTQRTVVDLHTRCHCTMLRQHMCCKNTPFFSSSNSSRQSNIETLFIHSFIHSFVKELIFIHSFIYLHQTNGSYQEKTTTAKERKRYRWHNVKMTARTQTSKVKMEFVAQDKTVCHVWWKVSG